METVFQHESCIRGSKSWILEIAGGIRYQRNKGWLDPEYYSEIKFLYLTPRELIQAWAVRPDINMPDRLCETSGRTSSVLLSRSGPLSCDEKQITVITRFKIPKMLLSMKSLEQALYSCSNQSSNFPNFMFVVNQCPMSIITFV